jgi:hypothetical protein
MPKIPNPQVSKSNYSKYVDHLDHTLNILVNATGEIEKVISIPKLNSVLDRLVSNNVNLSRIVNGYLKESGKKHPQAILFLSDSTHFEAFLSNKIASYILSQEPVAVRKSEHELHVEFDSINFILSSDLDHLNYAHQKTKVYSISEGRRIDIKSIIIDLTSFSEAQVLRYIQEEKLKFDRSQSFILAFNSQKIKIPPLELRDYLESKFKIGQIDMLNFNRIDGLKSISLQAYYNLVDDEIQIRDAFEKRAEML